MSKRVRIPVRVVRPMDTAPVVSDPWPRARQPVVAPVEAVDEVASPWPPATPPRPQQAERLEEVVAQLRADLEEKHKEAEVAQAQAGEQQERAEQAQVEAQEWRERALRLQAEMDNFRKRQRRLAQDEIAGEREHLLRAFLQVVDDLERALDAPPGDAEGLRRGVEITRRAARQLLEKAGVEPVPAEGQPFDPNWHEAVGTVPADAVDAEPDTVAQVLQAGYRLGETLLRPAKVIVAV